jgi:hypothetical protein
MNNDTEAMKDFLAWLLQESDVACSTPSGDGSGQTSEPASVEPQLHHLNSFDSDGAARSQAGPEDSNSFSFQEIPLFEPGDIPAVQDRFYALLKRRLRTEIERKPPLFPWENGAYNYDSETYDWAATNLVPTTLWTPQLNQLSLPVPLPTAVLSRLFERCHELVKSSLQEGAKLVQAVEDLFPDNSSTLHQLAGMVMTAPARSGAVVTSLRAVPGFPQEFEDATHSQQMVLSLLAAREILNALRLDLSPSQRSVERQWTTSVGVVTLRAVAGSARDLTLHVQIPNAGSIEVRDDITEISAKRLSAGNLSVKVFDIQPDRVYPVEVRLNDESTPLIFAVRYSECDD